MAWADRLELRVVPFAEWRREIAPLWRLEGAVAWIPRLLGGHGQLRYAGAELAERVLLFPIAAELDGRRVGWTSAYNVSDEAIRLRGIYVLPECRAMGIGRRLADFACALWPAPWRSCLIYARAANVAIYERWGFAAVPGHTPRSTELDRVLPDLTVQLMSRPIAQGIADGGARGVDAAVAANDDRARIAPAPANGEIDAAYAAALATASSLAEAACARARESAAAGSPPSPVRASAMIKGIVTSS